MRITNCKIVTENKVIDKGTITFEDGIITKIEDGVSANADLDANGKILFPGVVDLHTHGSGDFDFMDGKESDIHGASRGLA